MHYLRPDLLVLGFSERTSPAALDELCDTVFAQGAVTDVIVVVMPKAPTAIHLDMIFTQVDRELCVVYPPFFVGPERLPVLHRRKGEAGVHEMPNFFEALRAVRPADGAGLRRRASIAPARSGSSGARPATSWRCARARIVSYRRNDATLCELQAAGFRVVPAVNFLAFDDWTDAKHRTVITIEGRRAGARRRRAALHVAAAPAGAAVIGLVGRIPRARCSTGCSTPLREGPRAAATLCHDVLGLPGRARRRCASGSPSRCSAPIRGCASSPTAAGGWCPRRRARRCSTTAPSRWWTSRPPGMRARRRRPDHRDRGGGGPRRPARGGVRHAGQSRAGRSRRRSAPSPTSPTTWCGTRRRSPSWPTRSSPRWPAGCSWPTTRGSTGNS